MLPTTLNITLHYIILFKFFEIFYLVCNYLVCNYIIEVLSYSGFDRSHGLTYVCLVAFSAFDDIDNI